MPRIWLLVSVHQPSESELLWGRMEMRNNGRKAQRGAQVSSKNMQRGVGVQRILQR